MTRTVLLLPLLALLQAKPNDWPFPSRSPAGTPTSAPSASPSAAPVSTPPPYDVALRQEPWEKLPDRQISRVGQEALALRPQQWRHGETENFVFHYRGLSEALQVAREIEFDLWYVANSLGAREGGLHEKVARLRFRG